MKSSGPWIDRSTWLSAAKFSTARGWCSRRSRATKAESPKLFFKPVRWLNEDEIETCAAKGESPEAVRAVMLTVSQQDGVGASAPAPAPLGIGAPPKAAKAKPAAAPAPEPEENAEPEVRKAKPAANAVPAAGKLADTLSAWDDE